MSENLQFLDKRTHQRHQRFSAALRLRRKSRPGTAPGTLIADPGAHAPVVRVTTFDADHCEEFLAPDVKAIVAQRGKRATLWVDVSGLADIELISAIGTEFGLHRLALEDVVTVTQRPKAEDFDSHLFLVARMLSPERGVETEQTAFFVGPDFLITFQERPGDCFDPVRERLRRGRGRIRELGADYLAYALIDALIDGYYPVLERYGEEIEELENLVLSRPEPGQVDRLHAIKRDLLSLRRAVWPTRELVGSLIRDETPIVTAQTRVFLRDCYDHVVQLMDVVETYREISSSLLEVYLSSMSAKLNEIMKVLTMIATIFIPLSFITGLYGMNFDTQSPWNMPELHFRYGYPLVLLVMLAIAVGLLIWFRRKRWFG